MKPSTVIGAALLVTLIGCLETDITQPLPFNHRIHTVDNHIRCDTCHDQARTGRSAGLPSVQVCVICHVKDITRNPDAEPVIEEVRRNAEAGTEIPWKRLYKLRHLVDFPHRRHTVIAGLPCGICHGDHGDSETVPTRPLPGTLDKNTCFDCHEDNGVPNQCTYCHR